MNLRDPQAFYQYGNEKLILVLQTLATVLSNNCHLRSSVEEFCGWLQRDEASTSGSKNWNKWKQSKTCLPSEDMGSEELLKVTIAVFG